MRETAVLTETVSTKRVLSTVPVMETTVGIALWVLLATAVLLLPPLLRSDVRPYHDQPVACTRRDGADRSTTGPESPRPTGRPMTDGGRICHSCGSYVEGDYQYCAACLLPKV